jgi:hypothetical protein
VLVLFHVRSLPDQPVEALPRTDDAVGDELVDASRKSLLSCALASTANFLKGHGWVRGAGYQPGQPNFSAIQGWNAAGVYQKAIAIIGKQIDG